MRTIIKISVCLMLLCVLTLSTSYAFWIFTPKDQKTVDPKASVKDTPKSQYEYAMNLYNRKEYRDAGDAFVRLVEHWKDSSVTPDAQYYAAVAYQNADRPYVAFSNYEKVIKYYPFSERINDIIKAEYEIGMEFYERSEAMLMGVELMGEAERAIEIFSAIIDHVPYSSYADNAQFMIGMSYKKLQQYTEAVDAFEKVVQEYPKSKLVDRAKYEIAQAMSAASKASDYDQQATDKAIERFKQYSQEIKSDKIKKEAEVTINRLREKKAKSIYDIADFYERMKKYRAAYIYYSEIFNEYKDTTYAKKAKERLDKKINPILDKKEDGNAEEPKTLGNLFGLLGEKDQIEETSNEPKKAWLDFSKKEEITTEETQPEQKEEEKDVAQTKPLLDFRKQEKTEQTQPEPKEKVKNVAQTKPLLDFRKQEKISEEPEKALEKIESKDETMSSPEKKEKTSEEPKKAWLDFSDKDKKVKDPSKNKVKKAFSFFGYSTGSLIYEGAQSIYIDNFKNEIDFTKEVTDKSMYVAYRSGIETDVTRAIIDRFLFDGHLTIKPDNKADLLLNGSLIKFQKEAIRYDDSDNVIEYRLSVFVSFTISIRDTGQVLVNEKNFAGQTTYRTTGTYAKTEQQAIIASINDLAIRVVNVVVESW